MTPHLARSIIATLRVLGTSGLPRHIRLSLINALDPSYLVASKTTEDDICRLLAFIDRTYAPPSSEAQPRKLSLDDERHLVSLAPESTSRAIKAALRNLESKIKENERAARRFSQALRIPFASLHHTEPLLTRLKRLRSLLAHDLYSPTDVFNIDEINALPFTLLGINTPRSETSNISCPFHKDSHPSARIYEPLSPRQRLHCFQCGFHGSFIDAYLALNNLPRSPLTKDTLKKLASLV